MGSEEVEAPGIDNMPKMLKLRHIPAREEAGEVIYLRMGQYMDSNMCGWVLGWEAVEWD
jgi:hypothetical protein